MKKFIRFAFNGLIIALVLAGLLSIYALCFRQLPADDLHYGYGILFFSFIVAPLIFLPLAIMSAIAAWVEYDSKKQHSKFYVFCFIFAAIGLVLAVCLTLFNGLYPLLNLNPQHTETATKTIVNST